MDMKKVDGFLKKCVLGNCIFLCLFLVNLNEGRPQMSYSGFSEPTPGPQKNYTGIRLKEDSVLLLYYHEQTVAIVETDSDRTLYACELLEVRTKADKKATLQTLKPIVSKQIRITFDNMIDLMKACNKLEKPKKLRMMLLNNNHIQLSKNPSRSTKELFTFFSGLYPGTKWCGVGDSASSFYDLGPEKEVDKCCRFHDLCPVKLGSFQTSYNLTNFGIYTKSHCECDNYFYDCLKALKSRHAEILGRLYFNLGSTVCLKKAEKGTKMEFIALGKKF